MTRIALLRHFPTAWNEDRRIQGRTDIPLTEGARQLLTGLRIPAAWQGADIVASPLSRAEETAQLLANGRPVRLDDRLVAYTSAGEGNVQSLHPEFLAMELANDLGTDMSKFPRRHEDPNCAARNLVSWLTHYTPERDVAAIAMFDRFDFGRHTSIRAI